MINIDMYHDPGYARMASILAVMPALTDYLEHTKTASLEDTVEKLPDGAFADSANRFFPIHTPKAAALSYAYAKLAQEDGVKIPDSVIGNLKEAIDAYGAPETLFEIVPLTEKTAAAEDCIFQDTKLYPVRNIAEVKLAEEALHREKTKLLPVNRAAAFVRLVEKAAEVGAKLRPESHRLAGLTHTDNAMLRDSLRARATATKVAAVKEAFEDLANAVGRSKKELDRSTRVKMAEAVEELDGKGDLKKYYDQGLAEPVSTVFNTTKLAEPGISVDGTNIPFTKLMSLHPSFYSDVLGDDFLSDLTTGGALDRSKLAEVLPTLPRDLQKNLKVALRGV